MLWSDYIDGAALFIGKAARDFESEAKQTKSGEKMVVPVPKRTAKYLDLWHDETPAKAKDDLVFFGSFPGKLINRRYVNVLFDTAPERAGIEKNGFQPYSFRRYCNTRMRTALKAYALLRQLMGHKTAGMTDSHDTPPIEQLLKRIEDARSAVERMWE